MINNSKGTFLHCSNCKIKNNCCCDFDDNIDNIVTTIKEKDDIVRKLGKNVNKHFIKINDEAFNILSYNGVCPFYDSNKCSIYDIRPADCRLFPYDLKEIGGKYYLIQYDLPCGSKLVSESVDEVIETLKPIITTYTDKKIEEKVNNLKFKIVKEVKI